MIACEIFRANRANRSIPIVLIEENLPEGKMLKHFPSFSTAFCAPSANSRISRTFYSDPCNFSGSARGVWDLSRTLAPTK
jgi:hypothetical protein